MLNVLVNAYAVSPTWGSEPGMGWNWVVNLAKYCNLFVVTEGEWRNEIEAAVAKLPQKKNLHFYYNPMPERVRHMCWNQGDWRFYWHYRKWQKRTLAIAYQIIANHHIDIIHQLNMIGFREPGYLWKIDNIPFVWGPIGGMELMPISYLDGVPVKQKMFNIIKNGINRFQYLYSSRVKTAIERADMLISAVEGVQNVLMKHYHKESLLINETGIDFLNLDHRNNNKNNETFDILWVGKFDFRKQLSLALRAIIKANIPNIRLHICGTGDKRTISYYRQIAEKGGIANQCIWYGNVEHDKILNIMAKSDLFFFTSIMEATSTVVLEAISVGLPVLSFNTCGFGPLVKHFAGEIIELSNPNQSVVDFAEKIVYLCENREALDRIRERILISREQLTWDSKAIKMTEIYNSVLKYYV